jgi:hypothetical protein
MYFDRATVRLETLTSLDLTSDPNRFLPLSLQHPLALFPTLCLPRFVLGRIPGTAPGRSLRGSWTNPMPFKHRYSFQSVSTL